MQCAVEKKKSWRLGPEGISRVLHSECFQKREGQREREIMTVPLDGAAEFGCITIRFTVRMDSETCFD